MKTIFAFLLATFMLFGCETSIDQLNEIKKPATVFAKHKHSGFFDESSSMIIRDANGNLIALVQDDQLTSLAEKYRVGDTIK